MAVGKPRSLWVLLRTEWGCVDQGIGVPWCRWVAVSAVGLHKVFGVINRAYLYMMPECFKVAMVQGNTKVDNCLFEHGIVPQGTTPSLHLPSTS